MGNLPDKTLHGGLFNNIFFEVSHSEKLNLRNPEQLRLFHLEVSNNLFVFGHLQQFIQRNIGQYVFSRAQIEEYELDGNAFSVGLDAMNVMKANANPGERDSGNDLGEILLFVFLEEVLKAPNPIQAEILKKLAEKECIVGVIGDKAQSIYKFQGADVTQFINFNLKGMVEYKIEGNHRSTEEIISILNIVRNDPTLTQYSPENRHGCKPLILVGDVMETYQQAKQICGKQTLWTLCYRNVTSNCLKKGYNTKDEDIMLEDIITSDSNAARAKQLIHVISSIENARDNKIKDALKLMKRAMRNEDANRMALVQLQHFLNNYDLFKDNTLTEFYSRYLDDKVFIKSKITKGKPKNFYDSKKYGDMALAVRIDDDDCIARTIHKAKGDENNCVMVVITETNIANQGLDFILKPNIDSENNRVYYVALSRAREKLFISIPKMDSEVKGKLIKVGFEIVNCS